MVMIIALTSFLGLGKIMPVRHLALCLNLTHV